MVAVTATSSYAAYGNYGTGYTATARTTQTAQQSQTAGSTAATSVTLSDEARAALAERDFTAVLADAHQKLAALLTEAGRTTPLKDGKLALDMTNLDARELYAISSDDSFSTDEREAAGLEMQRRFEEALSGPAAIAKVTGDYSALYRKAATYLDSLGAEEKASDDWKAGRDAVAAGLKEVEKRPGTLPDMGPSDPVGLYLALSESRETKAPPIADLAANSRTMLDRLYADARAGGKAPTFNRATKTGQFIDVSNFSSRALSSIVLDTKNQFSGEEVNAARATLQARTGATLVAGFQNASKSADPTAFSQNIINAFTSMSAEERAAAGWSDQLYQTAMQNYVTTSKLMNMFTQATGNTATPGLATLLGGQ